MPGYPKWGQPASGCSWAAPGLQILCEAELVPTWSLSAHSHSASPPRTANALLREPSVCGANDSVILGNHEVLKQRGQALLMLFLITLPSLGQTLFLSNWIKFKLTSLSLGL